MVSYFPSRYNFLTKYNNNLLLYNSLSGKIICLQNAPISDLKFLEDDKKINLGQKSSLVKTLHKYRFIYSNEDEEREQVSAIYKNCIESKELFLEILPTEQCNFRCSYCYESYCSKGMDQTSIHNLIEFVEEKISGCTALRIAWFGGEPMLELNTIEILSEKFIAICKREKIPYYASMTTNGYFLQLDKWERLKKCRIFDYQISVDGLANVHNNQRFLANGEGTWEMIINNLKSFRDQINSSIFSLMIRINITKPIYDDRLNTLKYFQKEFSKDKRFHFFFHLAEDWGNANDANVKEKFCGTEEFYTVIEQAAKLGLKMPVFKFFLTPGSRVCFAAKKNSYVITPEGAIRKCSLRLNDENNKIGNVNIKEELKLNPYQKKYCSNKKVVCAECKKLPICFGAVCPSYSGDVSDTCGYDVSDVERLIQALYISDSNLIEKLEYGENFR